MTVTMEQAQFDWFGVWNSAGPAGQIFLFLLMLVGLYAVYFAAFACLRLRTLRPIRDADAVRKALASLNHRSANLRQLVVAMFFLFGFFYLLQIRSVYATPDTTRPIPVGLMVLENLEGYFLHAAPLFLVFFVLHALAWFASSKIRAATLQLDH